MSTRAGRYKTTAKLKSPTMPYPFRNLVFEGGVKGIAYVGAMRVLEAKEIR
jgi:hypothetical protein